MRPSCRRLAAAGLLATCASCASALRTWQPVRELQKQVHLPGPPLASAAAAPFPAYNLTGVPVDHFHNDSLYEPHVDDTFNLRYWFDASHYQPGGPVLVLLAGETSGANRLPFLQKGILAQLAQATHGFAVVLEHRYYGTSFPYDNLTTESLRFLRTEQALADTAYFAEHVRFPVGNDSSSDSSSGGGLDLSPASGRAPWIVYGGSYAGAFAAFLRVLYPDLFWGAISSSGVTAAIHDYWRYYEAQRLYAPPACVDRTQTLIHVADQILLAGREAAAAGSHDQTNQALLQPGDHPSSAAAAKARVAQLQSLFGFPNVTHDDDFASLLSDAMGGWQEIVWDPAESSPDFDWYCANVTASGLLYPALGARNASAQALLAATSYRGDAAALAVPLLNFAGWVQATHACPPGVAQDACFANRAPAFHQQADLRQRWRSWTYQYCTQWGYLATGSGVPADQRPLVSRLLDLDYLSIVCREAFNVTAPPDVDSVNRLGGLYIHYPQLAIVDGEADPWRAATPHALEATHQRPGNNRTSSTAEPFLLIAGKAVHHWDEYGLLPSETTPDRPPAPVRQAQAAEASFVQAWVADWAGQNLEADDGRL